MCKSPGPLEDEKGPRAALGLDILTKVDQTRTSAMTLSIDLSDEELEKILLGDRGKDLLMEKVFNQIPQAEMTDQLGVNRYERSEDRTGYRNGSYECQLTTRVGKLTLEVPRCKAGSFSTKLFERYQRSEKALVLTLMEWGLPRRVYPPSQKDHY